MDERKQGMEVEGTKWREGITSLYTYRRSGVSEVEATDERSREWKWRRKEEWNTKRGVLLVDAEGMEVKGMKKRVDIVTPHTYRRRVEFYWWTLKE